MSKNIEMKLLFIRLNASKVKDFPKNVLKTKSCYRLLLSPLSLYTNRHRHSATAPPPDLSSLAFQLFSLIKHSVISNWYGYLENRLTKQ